MSAPLKMTKKAQLRKRFVSTGPLLNPENWAEWSDLAATLKTQILKDSTFQLVGNKTILRIDSSGNRAHVLLEVLGIPQLGLGYTDQEALEVLVYEFPENIFEIDFFAVRDRARDIKRKIAHELDDVYDIVIEGHYLALHFFMQKDYIQ